MWIMATNTQPQETPEYRAFREHYDRLYHAIQDPLSLATRLFSRGIITSVVKEKVTVSALTRLEKNDALLTAVLGRIRTDLRMFHEFLSTLNEDTSMKSLVKSIQGMISLRVYSIANPTSMQFKIPMSSLKHILYMHFCPQSNILRMYCYNTGHTTKFLT